jgi:MFS family permease
LRLPARQADLLLPLVALGVFIAADDQTSVVALLPQMISDVGLAQDRFYRAAWIINGYVLGYIVAMPLMGRIADVWGHGRVFVLALLLFAGASVPVALAPDLTTLSIARGVQAVGGGALVPIAMAMVADSDSQDRRALGLGAMGAAAEAGGLLGPLWGGGIAEALGWRGVFWLNLPMALLLAPLIWRLSPVTSGTPRAIDWAGALLLGFSLASLSLALTDDPIQPRAAALTLALLLAASGLFGVFIWRQLRTPAPLIDLSSVQLPGVSAALLINGLVGGALIVAMVNVPLFTSVILQGSALEGGLNLMRLTLTLALGALAGGVITGSLGAARATAVGLTCASLGFLGLSRWDADPSALAMTLPLLVAGLGLGLVIAPLTVAVLSQAGARERATLAALLTVIRLLGALVGVALLTTRGLGSFYAEAGLLPLGDPDYGENLRSLQVQAFQETFLVAAGVCLLALLPAVMLPRTGRPTDATKP